MEPSCTPPASALPTGVKQYVACFLLWWDSSGYAAQRSDFPAARRGSGSVLTCLTHGGKRNKGRATPGKARRPRPPAPRIDPRERATRPKQHAGDRFLKKTRGKRRHATGRSRRNFLQNHQAAATGSRMGAGLDPAQKTTAGSRGIFAAARRKISSAQTTADMADCFIQRTQDRLMVGRIV